MSSSATIRTACSASLVALHEACVAIVRGDCESAIVGGVNLIMTPGATMSMTEQGVLSPDGSCKSFSADANGYARGEGITAVYIKRLDDALKNGDPVRAVIRATATNSDGKTPSLTVPSSDAQEALIRSAYNIAGISDFSKTAFVECHGTGTMIGDPIEAIAVGRIFGQHGVHIGSIKPNFGHTEGASGLLSIIKTVLALENNTIPPNIKFSKPNLAIPFKSAKLTVPTEPTSWPLDRADRASVNSFGIGGSNAHVIIDSAKSYNTPTIRRQFVDEPQLLLFSANSPKSLARMVDNYRDYIGTHPDYIADLAYTLANKREHLPRRTFAVASKGSMGIPDPMTKTEQPSAVIMVFTGQGAQWPNMGRELIDSNPTFLESIRRLDKCLQSMSEDAPKWRIEDELRKAGNTERMNSAELAQPLCTAIQIALVDTFASLGLWPSAVIGHSSGEIAAAYAAGAHTAEEAIINAMYRGALTTTQKRSGAMAAIGMSWEETEKFLSPALTIACDNSPSSVTISGDGGEIEAAIKSIHKSKPQVLARRLQVDKAYHSYHMAEVGGQYCSKIKKIVGEGMPTTLFFSSVLGCLLQSTTLGPRYWRKNLELPVLFKSAISSILQHSVGKNAIFLEIGPHAALAGPLRQNLSHASNTAPYVSAMLRNQNCFESFLTAIGKLHTCHIPINLQALLPTGSCLSDLPPYPWDHEESHWYESRLSQEYRQRKFPHHDLLGSKVHESTELQPSWRNIFHLDSAPWVRDHKVGDDIVFPFAGYVAMAGEAVRQVSGIDQTFHLRHVVVSTALVISEGKPTEIITTFRRQRLTDTLDSQWWDFTIASHNGHTWSNHCSGMVMSQSEKFEKTLISETYPRKVNERRWFTNLQQAGLDLGPTFRNLGNISAATTTQRATGIVSNNTQAEAHTYHLHPTAIDSALQLLGIAFATGLPRKHQNRLPVSCENISVSHSRSTVTVNASTSFTGGSVMGELEGTTDENKILSMSGLKLAAVDNSNSTETNDTHSAARLHWRPDVEFMDPKEFIKPSIDRSLYTSSLDELNALCLLRSQRRKAEDATQKLHLQKYYQWINDQVASQDLSSLEYIDNSQLDSKIDCLVRSLSESPAYPAAVVLQKICLEMDLISSSEASSWEDLLTSQHISGFYNFIDPCDASPFIQALAHSRPNLRVLEIGSWRSSPSKHILRNLMLPDGKTLWSKYTFTSKGFISPQGDEKNLPNLEYITLDINDDPFEQGFEDCQYELIIASNAIHSNKKIGQSLRNIRKLLHPSGHLVLQELCPSSKWINYILGTHPRWWCGLADGRPEEPYINTERWQRELKAAGYGSTDAIVLDAREPLQLNATMIVKPTVDHFPPKRITVLRSHAVSDADPVLQALKSHNFDILECTLQDRPPPGRDVFALLDREKPILEDLNTESFESFKSFIQNLDGSGIFWVTQLSQMHCQDPRYAQIIGLARTIRAECLIDFATCEADDIDASASQLVKILTSFQRRKTDDLVKPDFEYSIVDGVVNIGRFYPFTLSQELLVSEENDRAVLDLEIPGRLSTLHWARKSAPRPLQSNEVQVEVHSVGLNFRVSLRVPDFLFKG